MLKSTKAQSHKKPVASKKMTQKVQKKKIQKKKMLTVAKRSVAATSATSSVQNLREFKPDAFVNEQEYFEPEYKGIYNGPRVAYNPDELPSPPSADFFRPQFTKFMHPDVLGQIRTPVSAQESNINARAAGLYQLWTTTGHKDKLQTIKRRIAARRFAHPGDDLLVADPFGIEAQAVMNNLIISATVSTPKNRVNTGLSAFSLAFLAIYAHDALTGSPFLFPGLFELLDHDVVLPNGVEGTLSDPSFQAQKKNFPIASDWSIDALSASENLSNTTHYQSFREQLFEAFNAPHSSITTRVLGALPFAVAGALVGTPVAADVASNPFLVDLKTVSPEVRRSITHLQRLQTAKEHGEYKALVMDALSRHDVDVKDVIPDGQLIDLEFNTEFFLPDPKKTAHH